MNEKMLEELRVLFNQVLDERDRLDRETHRGHHDWIRLQIEKEKERKEKLETFKKSVIGAIAVTMVGAVIKLLAFIGGLLSSGAPK